MEVRYSPDAVRFLRMNTEEIRKDFLVDNLFKENRIDMIYSDIDRAVIGSAVPAKSPLELTSADEIRAEYFCARREMGILNIGAKGMVNVDGKSYEMENTDGLYVGRGSRKIVFESADPADPARFYLLSYPAHKEYPTRQISKTDVEAVHLGSFEESNKRSIYKYIHPDGIKSCQLVMGITQLEQGSVWNTMPPHTHERRMEVYLYFDVKKNARIFHYCGKPDETRHIVVCDGQAVISPSWSIHSGVGTCSYTFCWGMGGENQDFDDMDFIEIGELK
ncbi:MAG: 5-dehydro-4-deoxy-D-glucuronate isomerase [bacterium]|nr:5-dehydro-4-deoxy-D-glucuronate isomerase [bacterium]